MELLPADVWTIIATCLSKRDLISLQLTNSKIMQRLNSIGSIWWGKHLSEYQQRCDEYYNGKPKTKRDQDLEIELFRMNPYQHSIRKCYNRDTNGKSNIIKILVSASTTPDWVLNPWKYMHHYQE